MRETRGARASRDGVMHETRGAHAPHDGARAETRGSLALYVDATHVSHRSAREPCGGRRALGGGRLATRRCGPSSHAHRRVPRGRGAASGARARTQACPLAQTPRSVALPVGSFVETVGVGRETHASLREHPRSRCETRRANGRPSRAARISSRQIECLRKIVRPMSISALRRPEFGPAHGLTK